MIDQEIRLQAVEHFKALDMETDTEFDELLEVVSLICNAPIAVLTLIDNDTLWYKVKKGRDREKMPRENAFCNYTIQGENVFIIPDTLKDKRYKNNDSVVNEPKIRFYAGAPLVTRGGHKIGTLCVIDNQPRELSHHQEMTLKMLSKQAIGLMELRVSTSLLEKSKFDFDQQEKVIKDAQILQRSFFESSPNFHILLNVAGEIIDYNKTAYRFIEKVHSHKMIKGELLAPFIAPDFLDRYFNGCSKALSGVNMSEQGSTDYGEFGVIYWEAFFETARDADGNIIGVSYIIRDVTDRKLHELKVIAQNNFLLKIAHLQAHEFRGPLSSILGMMELIKTENFEAPREYYELLEQAVTNFDEKIKEIVSHIDEYKMAYEENKVNPDIS